MGVGQPPPANNSPCDCATLGSPNNSHCAFVNYTEPFENFVAICQVQTSPAIQSSTLERLDF